MRVNLTIELRRPARRSLALVLGVLLLAAPAVVLANHQFPDVPPSHFFHNQIGAIAEAGITTGDGNGNYNPSNPVSRAQMAAFMHRGLGRGAFNHTFVNLTANQTVFVTGVAIDAGAAGSGNGFVLLHGTVSATVGSETQCPCHLEVAIVDQITSSVLELIDLDIDNAPSETGTASAAGSVQAAVPIAAGVTGRFGLRVHVVDANVTLVDIGATLSAIYFPFGADGDNTLAHCPSQEGEPNNTIANAEPLVSPMFGCLEPANDRDTFSTFVTGGYQLIAYTTGIGGAGTCDTDTFIEIRNSADTLIASNDDVAPGYCSYAFTGPLTAGTYFVVVRHYNSIDTGTYRLVAAPNDPNSNPATLPGLWPPEEGDKP